MVTCKAITGVSMAESYYQKDDYYTSEHSKDDVWRGKLAEQLGYKGQVTAEKFNALISKSAARKTGIQKGKEPTLGVDMTVTVPKSLSVAQAESPEMQQRIDRAYSRTMDRFLAYVEDNYIFTKRGHGGKNLEHSQGMISSLHNHDLNRDNGLTKHTHIFIHSYTMTADGKIRTLAVRKLMQSQLELGAVFRGMLAEEVRKEGLHPVLRTWDHGGDRSEWELEGYDSEALINELGTRRQAILKDMEERGVDIHDAKQAQLSQMRTRKRKVQHVDLDAVKRETKEFLDARNVRAVLYDSDSVPTPGREERQRAITDAISEVQEKSFDFSEDELQKVLCIHGGFYGIDVNEAKSIIASDDRLVRIKNKKNRDILYTTQHNIDREREIQQMWKEAKGRYSTTVLDSVTAERTLDGILKKENLERLKKGMEPIRLADEQRKMILHCCCSDENVIVNGSAGTGKTFSLQYVGKVLEQHRIHVAGAAFTGKAADGLVHEAYIDSNTMDSLMLKAENESLKNQGIRRTEEIDFRKKTTFNFDGLVRDRRKESAQVMILDEAGMCNDAKLHEFQRLAAIKNWRLVLAGDVQQYKPIGPGQPMHDLIREGAAVAYLRDIKRQKAQEDREAAKEFVKENGSVDKAIDHFIVKGYLMECENSKAMQERCISDFMKSEYADEDKLILVDTNAERKSINETIRGQLTKDGKLGDGHEFTIAAPTDDDMNATELRTFHENERVIFLRNGGMQLDVKNGTLGTITKIDGDQMTVNVGKSDDLKLVTFSMNEYNAIDAAYAVTGMKSQGMSIKDVYTLNRSDSISQEHASFYVETTRYKNALHIYTDDLAKLRSRVRTAVDKLTKLDYDIVTKDDPNIVNSGYVAPQERADARLASTPPLSAQERLRRMQLEDELGHPLSIQEIPPYATETGTPVQKMSETEKVLRADMRDELRQAEIESPEQLRKRIAVAQESLHELENEQETAPSAENSKRMELAQERLDGLQDVQDRSMIIERRAFTDTIQNASDDALWQMLERVDEEDEDTFHLSREERRKLIQAELAKQDELTLANRLFDDMDAIRMEDASMLSPEEKAEFKEMLDQIGLTKPEYREVLSNALFGRDRLGGLHFLPYSKALTQAHGLKPGKKLSFRKVSSLMKKSSKEDKRLGRLRSSIFKGAAAASSRHIVATAGKSAGGAFRSAAGAAGKGSNEMLSWLDPDKKGTDLMKDGAKKVASAAIKTPVNIVADIIRNPIVGLLMAPFRMASGLAKMADGAMSFTVGATKAPDDEQRVRVRQKEKTEENEFEF